jgi:hypothetical protein
MSKKKPPKDFENSTFTVIKGVKDCHNFSPEMAKVIGLERACILANIDDAPNKNLKGLSSHFKYIPEKRLEELVNELIESGDLVKGGEE